MARIYKRVLGWLDGDPRSASRPLILANLGVIELLEQRYRRALEYEQAALRVVEASANRDREGAEREPTLWARYADRLARLVSTETEIRACARLFGPGRSVVLTGCSASENERRRLAPQPYRYWHLTSQARVQTWKDSPMPARHRRGTRANG